MVVLNQIETYRHCEARDKRVNFRQIVPLIGLLVYCFGMGDPKLAAAGNEFDGDWITRMNTQSGGCRSTYKFVVSIKDGTVSGFVQGNLGKYDISGRVTDSGEITMHIEGGDPVEAAGKLEDTKGDGNWKSSRECIGEVRWRRK